MVKIDVKFVDGHWEYIGGGVVPVKNGTIGELRIDKNNISEHLFLNEITRKHKVKIFDEGASLIIALKPDSNLSAELQQCLKPLDSVRHSHTAKISGSSRFIEVFIGPSKNRQFTLCDEEGGLWLDLEGVSPKGITSSQIVLPNIEGLKKTANSLNHAYTMLSEIYEHSRISHTGNIYEHVLYPESDGIYYPLKDLRNREMAKAERKIINNLWLGVIAGNLSQPDSLL